MRRVATSALLLGAAVCLLPSASRADRPGLVFRLSPPPAAPFGAAVAPVTPPLTLRPGLQSASGRDEGDPKAAPQIRPILPRIPSPHPHPLRAHLEFWPFMAYSQTKYWLKYFNYVEDWQYQLSWHDQKRRFFTAEAIRFDSNAFQTNWTHALAGAIYYQFGRTNGLTWRNSALFALTGSLYWEYVVEWREVISINDMLFTTFGGMSNGEAWFQIARRLAARRNLPARLLSWLNPIHKLNYAMDGRSAAKPEPGEFEFRVELGLKNMPSTAGPEATLGYAGFRSRSVNLPAADGDAAGRWRWLGNTFYSEMAWNSAFRRGHWDELNFLTRVATCGWTRSRAAGPDGPGRELYIGLGTAFSYFQKHPVEAYDTPEVKVKQSAIDFAAPRNFRDKLSAVHMAGPLLGWAVHGRDWRLRLMGDAYVDFGLVNALALNEWSRTRSLAGMKTTLSYYGYYYALGGTASAEADLDYRGLNVEARWWGSAYGSIDHRDRFQDEIANPAHVSDRYASWSLRTGFRFPGLPVELTAVWEGVDRRGRLRPLRVKAHESRAFFGFTFYL